MQKETSRVPSPAFVLAAISLLVSLSGVAVALPGKKNVDRNDLRSNVVASKHVKAESLSGDDLAADSIQGADLAEASLGVVPESTRSRMGRVFTDTTYNAVLSSGENNFTNWNTVNAEVEAPGGRLVIHYTTDILLTSDNDGADALLARILIDGTPLNNFVDYTLSNNLEDNVPHEASLNLVTGPLSAGTHSVILQMRLNDATDNEDNVNIRSAGMFVQPAY